MYCTQCGIEISQGSGSCSACGAPAIVPVRRAAVTPVDMPVPSRVEASAASAANVPGRPWPLALLATWQFIKAAFIFMGVSGFLLYVRKLETPPSVLLLTIVVAGLVLLCGLYVAGGIGLLKLRPYGRFILRGLAWLELIVFPIGTAISIFVLLYLGKPKIKALFAAERIDHPGSAAQLSRSLIIKVALAVVLVVALFFVAISKTVPSRRAPGPDSSYAPLSVVILSEDASSVVDDFNNVTERDIAETGLAMDESGTPLVWIEFTPEGALKMEALTRDHVDRRIVFAVNGEVDRGRAAVIRGVISKYASISFQSMDEAKEFVRRLERRN